MRINFWYDKKTKIINAVELPDGTRILVYKKGLQMAFPIKKFKTFFKKQEKGKYYEVLFTPKEINILTSFLGTRKNNLGKKGWRKKK